jgi:hypothetical protein
VGSLTVDPSIASKDLSPRLYDVAFLSLSLAYVSLRGHVVTFSTDNMWQPAQVELGIRSRTALADGIGAFLGRRDTSCCGIFVRV